MGGAKFGRDRCRIIVGALFVCGSAVATFLPIPSDAQSKEDHVIFPEQAAVLSDSEVTTLRMEAMKGDAESAHRLATYYAMIKLDVKKAIYWQQIRVENGDRDARFDLGAALAADTDRLNRIRARYWFKQIESDSTPRLIDMAKYALESLNDKEKYEEEHGRQQR
jgi:hypothetical protein